ncbi:MAG: ABC transporter substrate-binding protein [Bifidobacterium pseudocatenulatum]
MMKSRTWKRVLAAVCAGVAAVSMAACGGGTNNTAKDGVIINSVMNSTSQASLNYNPFSSTALTGVVGALYEPLFYMNNLKDDPTKLEPLMGKSYTISDDAKTIDVTIRDGEKWSDGEPYTTEDVAYTFNLLNSNKALNTSGFAGSAKVLSDTEVRITLDKPESVNALSYLSGTMIVPKHVWEKIDDPVTYTNKDAVGSGPFTVKGGNFSPTAYTFKKNPYYWDEGKPEIDGVRYVLITGGTQASQNALTAGDVDWMSAIFPNMDDVLSGYPDIKTVNVPSSQMAFMTCSNKELGCSGPTTDPAVRKAIYYALDRNQINKLALNGQYSELAGSLYPYGQFTKYASDDVPDSPIPGKGRTDEAVKILEDAGYTKGDDGIYQKDGVKLSIKVAVMSDVSDWINAINVASQQLKKSVLICMRTKCLLMNGLRRCSRASLKCPFMVCGSQVPNHGCSTTSSMPLPIRLQWVKALGLITLATAIRPWMMLLMSSIPPLMWRPRSLNMRRFRLRCLRTCRISRFCVNPV